MFHNFPAHKNKQGKQTKTLSEEYIFTADTSRVIPDNMPARREPEWMGSIYHMRRHFKSTIKRMKMLDYPEKPKNPLVRWMLSIID